MGDDRPIRYLDPDGTVVYRASGLGACDGVILGLAAGRVPNEVPEWLQEVFDEGHVAEPQIIAMLGDEGLIDVNGLDTQPEIEFEVGEFNDRRVIIRAHADGWDGGTLVECKKFRDSTWPKFLRSGVECSPLYPWQTAAMWWGLDEMGTPPERMLFTGGHWDGEKVIEIDVKTHTDPPLPRTALLKRIARWERMIGEGLDVADLHEPCANTMYPCPMFAKGCPSEKADDEVVELDGERAEVAELLGEQLETQQKIMKTAKDMLDAAKKKRKDIESALRGIHEDLGESPKKMRAGRFTFTHVTGTVEPRMTAGYDLDYFKLKAEKAPTNEKE